MAQLVDGYHCHPGFLTLLWMPEFPPTFPGFTCVGSNVADGKECIAVDSIQQMKLVMADSDQGSYDQCSRKVMEQVAHPLAELGRKILCDPFQE
ncbi:hypothetical protein D3C80_1447820 [compost metagenome]